MLGLKSLLPKTLIIHSWYSLLYCSSQRREIASQCSRKGTPSSSVKDMPDRHSPSKGPVAHHPRHKRDTRRHSVSHQQVLTTSGNNSLSHDRVCIWLVLFLPVPRGSSLASLFEALRTTASISKPPTPGLGTYSFHLHTWDKTQERNIPRPENMDM